MTDNAPVRDGTTTPPHIDSKRRKKLRQKKTVLGVTEGGFLLPELLAALAVDVQRHSRSVTCRCIVRHLLHSTAKAHSVAHKINAAIEIHAHR